MSDDPTRPARRRTTVTVLGVLAVLVVLSLAAGAYLVGSSTSASASSVTLVPAGDPGTDPFTESVAVGPAADFPDNVQAIAEATRNALPTDAATGTAVATGTAPGLYGGSGSTKVCDPDQLVSYLTAHPKKAAAWAQVMGIRTRDIGSYVGGLTPVLLTSDTLVTNHGYRNGEPTTVRSVLQAGTAVMVDAGGVPRVKCNCGNPLGRSAPAALTDVRVVGRRWQGWSTRTVVVVRPGKSVTTLKVIDPASGDPATVTVSAGGGSKGSGGGGRWVAAEPATDGRSSRVLASDDGSAWTQVGEVPGVSVTGLARGADGWIAVGGDGDNYQSSKVLRSTDLTTWTQTATIDGQLADVAYADGRWVAVGGWAAGVAVGGVDHSTNILHTSTDGTNWSEVELTTNVTDGDSGNFLALSSVTHQGGVWQAVGTARTDNLPGGDSGYGLQDWFSTDGLRWTEDVTPSPIDGDRTAIASSPAEWLMTYEGFKDTCTEGCGGPELTGSASTGHGTTYGEALTGTPFDTSPADALAWGGGRWLAVSNPAPAADGSAPTAPATFYGSPDARTWTKAGTLDGLVTALAFGGSV